MASSPLSESPSVQQLDDVYAPTILFQCSDGVQSLFQCPIIHDSTHHVQSSTHHIDLRVIENLLEYLGAVGAHGCCSNET